MLEMSIPPAVLGMSSSVIVSSSGKDEVGGRGAVAGSVGVGVVDAWRMAAIEGIAVGVDLVHGVDVGARSPVLWHVLRRRGRGVDESWMWYQYGRVVHR